MMSAVVLRADADAGGAALLAGRGGSEWILGQHVADEVCRRCAAPWHLTVAPSRLPNGGSGLFTTRALAAGDVALAEAPLLTMAPEDLEPRQRLGLISVVEALRARDAGMSLDPYFFLPALVWPALDPALRQELRGSLFWPEAESPDGGRGSLIQQGLVLLRQLGLLPPRSDAGELGFLLAAHANCFECRRSAGDSQALPAMAVCRVAAKANHSCVPNCWWCFEDGRLLLRAVQDLPAGAELTHAYFDLERWEALAARRAALLPTRGFLCACPRCTEEEAAEDLERLQEQQEQQKERQRQTQTQQHGQRTKPGAAGATPDAQDISELLDWCDAHWQELSTAHVDRLVRACRAWDQGSLRLAPPRLARLHGALHDLHKGSRNWTAAAAHAAARLAALAAAFDRPTNRTAWLREELGDALAGAAGLPERIFLDPDFRQALARTGGRKAISPHATVLRSCPPPQPVDAAAVLRTYREAEAELQLVYGAAETGHHEAATPGARALGSLRRKIQEVAAWVPPQNERTESS